MLDKRILQSVLEDSADKLRALNGNLGMEAIIQSTLCSCLGPESRTEVPLTEIGATQVWGDDKGRLDVLHSNHGIEIKVIQLPRSGNTPSTALYDIGQLSGDYWRLQNATELEDRELLLLLSGPIISALKSPRELLREFHNRMFVDFQTSILYGELVTESSETQRARQIGSIYQMGFHLPFNDPLGKIIVILDNYALCTIPVIKI